MLNDKVNTAMLRGKLTVTHGDCVAVIRNQIQYHSSNILRNDIDAAN